MSILSLFNHIDEISNWLLGMRVMSIIQTPEEIIIQKNILFKFHAQAIKQECIIFCFCASPVVPLHLSVVMEEQSVERVMGHL